MAASNRSSEDPAAPEPRLARPFLGRPATAPLRAPVASTTDSTPRLPRPFVPRGATPRASDAVAESRAQPPLVGAAERDVPLTEAATSPQGRPTDGAPGADSGWPSSPVVDNAVLGVGAAVVPGADAPARGATPDASKQPGALLDTIDAADVETAADAEWLAMSELGDFEPPSADRADGASLRSDRSEHAQQRAQAELGAAVVPPAEAWPDDVWAETSAAASEPITVYSDLPHPVALTNELAPAGDNDATLGAMSTEPAVTSYPPSVPDSLEAYALDGAADDLASPSAVYAPDSAHEWVDSAGGVGAFRESIAPVGGENPVERASSVVRGAAFGEETLAARLRQLADEVEVRSLAVDGFTPGLRDSEVLVSVLGALLRANR